MIKAASVLFSILMIPPTSIYAERTGSPVHDGQKAGQIDPDLEKAVNEALKAIQKESPLIHEDSLRVWKNFSATSKPVNFTYRFWGRRLILWLKEEKKMAFHSEEQIGEVFKILWRKGLISQNAVVVLMVDAWSHLVYLEGSPSWEKRMENRTPEGGVAPDASPHAQPVERGI